MPTGPNLKTHRWLHDNKKQQKIAPKLIYEFTACKSPSQISIQVAALMAFCCASWFLKTTNAHDVVDLRETLAV